jgi:hypothetical protein
MKSLHFLLINVAVPASLYLLLGGAAAAATIVNLEPGQDVISAVKNAPEGTVFNFKPGVYRGVNIVPKNNQQFIGVPGTVFSGATVLADWKQDGRYWVKPWDYARLQPQGRCRSSSSVCNRREDLFVDGAVYLRVSSLAGLGPGRWFDDGNNLYMTDNPKDRKIELSVVPRAIGGEATGVLLKNLTVEKYASAAQRGAIDTNRAREWRLENLTVRFNHGVGIRIGPGFRLSGGNYSNNGQLGIGGNGTDAVIEDAEIAYNNYAGFAAGWEAGGTKFWSSQNLIVRRTCVHHNDGPGLWTDNDNTNILYEQNKVFENTGDGIKHEISFSAIIRNNIVARNGRAKDNWLWGSQILVQNSSNVEVYGNTVEVAATFGNGISIIHQDRSAGYFSSYAANDVRIHQNTVVHLGPHGRNGLVADYETAWFREDANNLFDKNTYVIQDKGMKTFAIDNGYRTWEAARKLGFEPNGTLLIEKRQPTSLSCR